MFPLTVTNGGFWAAAMCSGTPRVVTRLCSKAGAGLALTASALGYAAPVPSAAGCCIVPCCWPHPVGGVAAGSVVLPGASATGVQYSTGASPASGTNVPRPGFVVTRRDGDPTNNNNRVRSG